MKYEFHVGDYVETKTGTIGFISKISPNIPNDEFTYWTPVKLSDADIKEEMYMIGNNYYIGFNPEEYFNRIGQYDFAKKDKSEIWPLIKSWVLEGMNDKGEYFFDSREVIKKINELVEAVNELRSKHD